MGQIYQHATQDIPTLLRATGVDDYTAQMLVPFMFMAPATTDLDMPSVIEIVRSIQRSLNAIGATLDESGELDVQTAALIQQVTGPGWKSVPWYQILEKIVHHADLGGTVTPVTARAAMGYAGSMGDFALPAMPGGIWGWAALGGLAYYYFGRKKR